MGNKPCSVEGCKTPSVKDGLCFKHYKEKHGKPPFISQKRTPCSIRGCKTPSVKDGFCWKHYREKYKEHPYTPSKVKKYTQKKSRVSSGEPADNKGKNIGMIEGKISGPGIISIPTAFLGQLLYSSELLDKQINSAIENGVVDIKTIINIRFRLGALLRGRILLARCLNETF